MPTHESKPYPIHCGNNRCRRFLGRVTHLQTALVEIYCVRCRRFTRVWVEDGTIKQECEQKPSNPGQREV